MGIHWGKTQSDFKSLLVFQDPRYNDEIAQMTGYKVESLLCHPIRNAEDEIVGVAQLLNKTTGDGFFNQDDETVLEPSLLFLDDVVFLSWHQ